MQKSDAHYLYGYKQVNSKKSRDQKDSKAKKNHYSPTTNSDDRNRGQSSQALSWLSKKSFSSNKEDQQG